MSEPTPQRVPPAPIRRIDWLAVAPWLILLRAPGAVLGLPLAVGALASLELSPGDALTPAPLHDLTGHVASCLAAFAALPRLFVGDPTEWPGWPSWLVHTTSVIAWTVAGLVAVGDAGRSITSIEGIRPSGRRAFFRWRWLTTAVGVACLTGVAAGGLAGLLWGVGKIASVHEMLEALLIPVGALLVGVPLAILLMVAAIGWPLLLAAIVLDGADAFDACSRVTSYTLQRLGRLIGYAAVAALVGVFAGTVLETLIAAVVVSTDLCVGRPEPGTPFRGAAEASLNLARGFYPAFFFTASTAIYLLLRRDVDGQPIDEMAVPTTQPSAEA